MDYSDRIIKNFFNLSSHNNLIARYSRILNKAFSDPDNNNKLSNLIEICDIEEAIDKVCNKRDKYFIISLLLGLSQKEIASNWHCSQSTVNRVLFKMRIRILNYLNSRFYYKREFNERLSDKRKYRDIIGT